LDSFDCTDPSACNVNPLVKSSPTNDDAQLSIGQAEQMIIEYYHKQKPDLHDEVTTPVEEIPFEEAWSQLGIQIFRVSTGIFKNETFLLEPDKVLPLGTAFGGQGLSSLEVSDLDQDGIAELIFVYSFGSGLHQSRVGMYAPAYNENKTFEADTGYLGDIGLFKVDEKTVGVQIIALNDDLLTIRYQEKIGYLRITNVSSQPILVLDKLPGLDKKILEALFPTR
jgi:hypothetical protein